MVVNKDMHKDNFIFKNKELYCEGVRVSDIAKEVGTPFYLYSYKALIDRFNEIKLAFKEVSPVICFSMKSNNNIAVLKALVDKGAGLDIVSGGELKKALMAECPAERIVFASVGKTSDEIISAIKAGILFFNVESIAELEEINILAERLGKKVQVVLRINPDVEAATHDAIKTGTLEKKFGIDLMNAYKIFMSKDTYPSLKLSGIHIHIGSQITSIRPFVSAIKKTVAFIDRLKKDGICLEYFDIGGGFGIRYKDEKLQPVSKFAAAIIPYLKKAGLKIVIEPGRFIAGNAGIFVTSVLYFKDNGVKKFFIVDGSMSELIRPSLYSAYHKIIPVKETTVKKIKVDVVGPVCESGDFLGKDRLLPELDKGQLLAVMSAGAYGYVMASNYNMRPRPAEVMVKGNRFDIVRRRESFKDLIKTEKIPEFLKDENS